MARKGTYISGYSMILAVGRSEKPRGERNKAGASPAALPPVLLRTPQAGGRSERPQALQRGSSVQPRPRQKNLCFALPGPGRKAYLLLTALAVQPRSAANRLPLVPCRASCVPAAPPSSRGPPSVPNPYYFGQPIQLPACSTTPTTTTPPCSSCNTMRVAH